MNFTWNNLTRFAAVGAGCSLLLWIGATNAQEESSVLVEKAQPAVTSEGPVLPPPANPNESAPQSDAPRVAPLPLPPQPSVAPDAKQSAPRATKRPFMRPAVPREPGRGSLANSGPEPMPVPPQPESRYSPAPGDPIPSPGEPGELDGIRVQPTPPIDYDTDGDARDMYRTGEIRLVMLTQNPADGCYYEIPMCIPACCEGEPSVSGGRGLLGRGVVEYCWPCGFRAIVKFRHILGDVEVEYEGD